MTIRLAAATAVTLFAAISCSGAQDSLLSDNSSAFAKSRMTLSLSPASRSASVAVGASAPADSGRVTLSGQGSATATWTATKRKTWTTLATSTGHGNGTVRWRRSSAGLAGVYVDTITVTASGATGSPARLIDTLRITPTSPPPPPPPGAPTLGLNGSLHGRQVFPASDPWNQPVDTAQIDPASATIMATIGLTTSLHPDFGASYNGGPFGIPYVVVPDTQTRFTVPFQYADESDAGPYPIPANPPIEPGGGDSHLLMITQGQFRLFELFALHGPPWSAGSGAIFDLVNGTTRPAGWTSADAAGLPIFPGLVRYDEVYESGAINHALRFTVVHSRQAYVAPARHWASSNTDPSLPPMGMRVRLKASVDISSYPAAAQVVLRALKKYGMFVADNGSNLYLSGTADARWNDSVNNSLKAIKGSDFEVVKMTGVVTH